jgi:XRE family transcriptional regulator, regulator of sulfur utilization
MSLGTTITTLRKSANLTQGKLAEACGLSQTYLSQIEKGKKMPHIDTLEKIGEVLQVPWPVMVFVSLEEKHIPEHKKEAYALLFPSIKALLLSFFPKSETTL